MHKVGGTVDVIPFSSPSPALEKEERIKTTETQHGGKKRGG